MEKFWQKPIKKTLFTLNINDEYDKELTDLTYPLLKKYAHKMGAEFHVIKERKFPEYPPTYEKLQIYQLAQEMENDWNLFIDCDALVHPDMMDVTTLVPFDTVAHFGHDFASNRWKYDRYFLRDGRNIGSCTWFVLCSSWCIDLWKPIDDMNLKDIANNIFPVNFEENSGIEPIRLIEDYVLSRNIAKFGLKYISVHDLLKKYNIDGNSYFYHQYAMPTEQKIVLIKKMMNNWNIV